MVQALSLVAFTVSSFLISRTSAVPTSSSCCDAFRSQFPGQVDIPEFATAYFSAQESDITPSCRVNPKTAEEVVQVLNITTQNGCKFAVRSGGHMPWAGSANIDEPGVTIDLGFLNSTTLSDDKGVAHVGPGARWGSVYDAIAPEGRVVVGGRGEDVGVGGFLLGGGLSFFSPKFGFGGDNVVGYQVILADGRMVEANSQENSDLFWAMRLAGTNFGIVTRYDLRTLPSTRMWGGLRSYNLSFALDAANAMLDFTEKVSAEGLDTLGLDFGNADEFFTNFAHIEPDIDNSDVFNATLDIPFTMDTTRSNVTLKNLIQEIDALFASGLHVAFRTISFAPDAQFMVDLWQEGLKIFAPYQGNANVSWTLGYSPISLSMLRAIEAADDAQGLATEDGAIMITNLSAFWTDDISEDDMQSKLSQLIEWGKATAQERGIWRKYLYLNYASPDVDPYASIPTDNAQRLRSLRKRFDPEDVFLRLWPGGFKL